MCPWHMELSHAPGTSECSYCCSPSEQSSKNCRSASTGVSEATCLFRCYSPPGVGFPSQKVQPLAIIPLGTLDCLTLSSMSPDGKLDRVPLLHLMVVCIGNAHRVTALCCLKLGGQAPVKCHMFTYHFSVQEIDFCTTFEVGWQVATLCQLMVLLGGKLIGGW